MASVTAGKGGVLLTVCQAITGGSNAVGAILCLGTLNGSVQVCHHGSTQSACFGKGHPAAAAATQSLSFHVAVGAADVADCFCHGVVSLVGSVARIGGGSPQSSAIISVISAASMAGSSQRTPSPVSPMNRPTTPSVMHRTNLTQGFSPSAYSTQARAVL